MLQPLVHHQTATLHRRSSISQLIALGHVALEEDLLAEVGCRFIIIIIFFIIFFMGCSQNRTSFVGCLPLVTALGRSISIVASRASIGSQVYSLFLQAACPWPEGIGSSRPDYSLLEVVLIANACKDAQLLTMVQAGEDQQHHAAKVVGDSGAG